jgi:serine/threonine protein kinase
MTAPSALERHQAAIGTRYVLRRVIGWGGLATLYLAHDTEHDRPVALKVLQPAAAAHIGRERFLQEIARIANLRNPSILSVQDFGEMPSGELWFITPYVEAESLRDRLTRNTGLAAEEAVRLMRELGDALAYAHGLGVVHGDIRPENILLIDGHASLADFGLTSLLSGPSVARVTPPADARGDTYALRAVLREIEGLTRPG